MVAPSDASVQSPKILLSTTLLGCALVWLAFPPVGWSGLVWIAPVLWLRWIAADLLPGRHPYRVLWLSGCAFWLLTVHWVQLPHPLNYLGWVALASYLGIYLPAWIALSRIGMHQFQLPLWLVAPIAWTGLDWLRSHLFTGFMMGSLAHTQYQFPLMIQIVDVFGEYGVTFLIVLVAACATQCLLSFQTKPFQIQLHFLIPAVIALGATLYYGNIKIASQHSLISSLKKSPRIALIQGNTLADWKNDREKQLGIMQEHEKLSQSALQQSVDRPLDLIIWPETAFRYPFITFEDDVRPPDTSPAGKLVELVHRLNTSILVGIDHVHISPDEDRTPINYFFNSAVFVDRQGEIRGLYNKMHRVVLGEYVPFSDWFPVLNRMTSITGSIHPGQNPVAMQQDDVTYAINICYESTVPHLIRRQVLQLSEQGQTPDVLVNITNDAWFWGSSELDMHLACGVFRAIEMQTPLVIAANGGLSAHIDSLGKLQQSTPRQQTALLLVDLLLPSRSGIYPSFYAAHGDWWFAGPCVVCCVVLAIAGWRSRSNLSREIAAT